MARMIGPSDALAAVPARYRGLWRRTLLRTADGRTDRETRVFWMQTAHLHIDIRVPATRPAFTHASHLGDLKREELTQLSTQMGFAGVTVVDWDEHEHVERCRWHRQIDYNPPGDARDIGTMHFDTPDIVLEDGIDVGYHERWEREALSTGVNWAMSLMQLEARSKGLVTGEQAPHDDAAMFVARCGTRFMLARARSPRAQALLAGYRNRSLAEVVRDPQLSTDDVRTLLDFEISLGQVLRDDGAQWMVDLSTLPWREGTEAVDAGALNSLELTEGRAPPTIDKREP
jgi:hypothetical protein